MPNKNNQVGVITEQGFVMGSNLGFKPIKENLNKEPKKEDDKKNKEKKSTK